MTPNTSDELLSIPVDKIIPNRNQPRTEFNETKLKELANSISDNGLIQPITVRHIETANGEISYEIIAGERRWRAVSQILEEETIAAIVKMSSNEKKSAIQALVENLDRENLDPIEEATAYEHLMKLNNWKQKEVAESLGKSRAFIANSVRLLHLPANVQNDIQKGLMDKSYGIALAGLKEPDQIEGLSIKSIKEGWSLKQLRANIEKIKNPNTPKKPETEPKSKKESALPKLPDIDANLSLLVVAETKEEQAAIAEELKNLGLKFFRNDALKMLL